jgi:hypothetical protein
VIQFFNNPGLNHLAATRVDRMCDISVKLCSATLIVFDVIIPQPATAVVAIVSPQVVLRSTLVAVRRQFPTWHRHKRSVITFDYFQIANNETIIKRNATKTSKPILSAVN